MTIKNIFVLIIALAFLISICVFAFTFIGQNEPIKYYVTPSNVTLRQADITSVCLQSDISSEQSLTQVDAVEKVHQKFADKNKWTFENADDYTDKDGRRYFVVHAYVLSDADPSDPDQVQITATMGWFYVNSSTGQLYEAYCALSEELIPLDKNDVQPFEEDAKYEKSALEKVKKIVTETDEEKFTYLRTISREGKTYSVLGYFKEEAFILYCVNTQTNDVFIWDIYKNELIKK